NCSSLIYINTGYCLTKDKLRAVASLFGVHKHRNTLSVTSPRASIALSRKILHIRNIIIRIPKTSIDMDVASGGDSGVMDIVSLRSRRLGNYTHNYTSRDAMLYALGLGCDPTSDLRYVYEGSKDFAVLPTYAIVAAHPSLDLVPLASYLPGGLDRAAALHGEQYLQLSGAPLPREGGSLVSRPQLVDVRAKGNGLVVVLRTVTTDGDSGREVAVNEFTTFILGKG
ncbi:hypothetical protein Agub_g10974, partial [Astrephomene gubernaculifera]